MDNTWVKLYRKLAENEVMKDDKALRIFIWLLLNVDKKSGTFTCGRYQIGLALDINPNTVYKAMKRLEEKYKIVTQSSNNKFTTISLLNWAKYQPTDVLVTQSGKNKVKTKEKQSNTKQEYKNKRIREYIYNIYFQKFLENFNNLYQSKYKPTKKLNELYNLRRKTFTTEEIEIALGCMYNQPFYKGKNDTGWKPTPEFLLRNDEKVDEFLNMQTVKKAPVNVVFSKGKAIINGYGNK